MSERLKDKVAIITGGANGLGKATAKLFCQQGAKIVVSDILTDLGEEVVQSIRDQGGEAVFEKADVTSQSDVQNLVDTAVRKYGRLDILMCNPAIQVEKTVPETSVEEWERVINLNIKGPFLCAKYAILQMQQQQSGTPEGAEGRRPPFGRQPRAAPILCVLLLPLQNYKSTLM